MTQKHFLAGLSFKHAKAPHASGFTTLELILVLMLMGILGGVLLSHANISFGSASESAALKDVARHIKARVAHVQNVAIEKLPSSRTCTVRFFTTSMASVCGAATDGIDISLLGESSANLSFGKDEKTGEEVRATTFPILTINSHGVIEKIENRDGSRDSVTKAVIELQCGEATETVEIVAGVKQ